MVQLNDGITMLEFTTEEDFLDVALSPNQYDMQGAPLIAPFLAESDLFLPGEITSLTKEKFVIRYHVPTHAISIKKAVAKLDETDRLSVIQKLNRLIEWQKKDVHLYMHPENFYLVGGTLKVAHRGLLRSVKPYEATYEQFLRQYKALVVSLLKPKNSYEDILEGYDALKDVFSRQVFEATTLEAVQKIVDAQYAQLANKRQLTQKLVSKKKFEGFKWGSLIAGVLALTLAITLIVIATSTLPKKERIVNAQTSFISSDYLATAEELKGDNPETLPANAQYILAVSYIHLETDLKSAQKKAALNQLSLKSTANELKYWIYIGQGNYEQAISIAENIDSSNMALFAYTKLVMATQKDEEMPGEEKKKKLEEYQEKMTAYKKLLDKGDSNGQ